MPEAVSKPVKEPVQSHPVVEGGGQDVVDEAVVEEEGSEAEEEPVEGT
jgi:hypothetical protein